MNFSEGVKWNCLEQIPDGSAGGGRGGTKHSLLLSRLLEVSSSFFPLKHILAHLIFQVSAEMSFLGKVFSDHLIWIALPLSFLPQKYCLCEWMDEWMNDWWARPLWGWAGLCPASLGSMELHFPESRCPYVSRAVFTKQELVHNLKSRSKATVSTPGSSCSHICREE